MFKSKVFSRSIMISCLTALFMLTALSVYADRGGWQDPPGGWTFIEEWQTAPECDDPKWNHNNGSDSWSCGANLEFFTTIQPPVYIAPDVVVDNVVKVEIIEGAGETEDGINPAADASVLTLIDLGDPRVLGLSDPSDRKIFFLGALHGPGELTEDPFIQGITFCARYKIYPIVPDPDIGASLSGIADILDEDGFLRYIPEQSDRAHVGVGYYDPDDPDNRVLIGTGYYDEGALSILVNDQEDPDGDENIPIISDIDTTEFHAVWVNAIADANDPTLVHVRAYADGSTTPIEATIQRGPDVADRTDPEDLQDNAEWSGLKELAFNIGSAGTGACGAFQYDYMVATMAGAFDPAPAGTPVDTWELY